MLEIALRLVCSAKVGRRTMFTSLLLYLFSPCDAVDIVIYPYRGQPVNVIDRICVQVVPPSSLPSASISMANSLLM